MTIEDDRFTHEDTANDRWIGALIHVHRHDTPERVNQLVDRSMLRLRSESATEAVRAAGSRGGSTVAELPRVHRWNWRDRKSVV